MRLAIIDLGTNSIRFDVHELSATRQGEVEHRRLYREKVMVRLGEDLFLKGHLSADGKRRTIKAVQSFHETIRALGVQKTRAFGTSAMRDASDGEAFLKELEIASGVAFKVITGAEEAALIAEGVLAYENPPKGVFALVDIGGGSTEVSICKHSGKNGSKAPVVLHSFSFNLGVARLQQVFLKSQPPVRNSKKKDGDPVTALRNHIKSVVLPKIIIEHWPKALHIIGSSGSIIALSKVVSRDSSGKKPFERKALTRLVNQMKSLTTAELLSIKGMEPKRVDLILAGGILLDELAIMLGAKTIRTTEYSLRDGALVRELSRFSPKSDRTANFDLAQVLERCKNWALDLDHINAVRSHAEWLFDALSKVHGLKKSWRPYLSAAALLHDSGEIISHAHHSEHSEYIIKNANFVGMQPWESELIATLARFHKEEKMWDTKNTKKLPYAQSDDLYDVFWGLLSILQISDALDRGHKGTLKLISCKISRSDVVIKIKAKGSCDLERLRIEQKKVTFEKWFGKKLKVV